MQEMLLDIPKFAVEYVDGEEYGYSSDRKKKNLKRVLSNASRGYCMYCYTRIETDGRNQGHLAHAVEKSRSAKLIDCVPNIGISCGICNDSCMKKGERYRVIKMDQIEEFEKENCRKFCVQPCEAYQNLKTQYLRNGHADIILQPVGVTGEDTGNELELQYDILEAEFIPSKKYNYSDREKQFIKNHIARFMLNDRNVRTKQLLKFLKDTINNGGEYTKVEYNNLIVDLFVELMQGKTKEEILKICNVLYSYSVVKFR